MLPRQYEYRLPDVMGHEEEIGYAVKFDDGSYKDLSTADLIEALPVKVMGFGQFLHNGGKFYVTAHPEYCTPECVSPTQLTTYIRANEDLAVDMAGNFLEYGGADCRDYQSPNGTIRIQRRVVDGHGRRWGAHDNFNVSTSLPNLFAHSRPAVQAFFGHIASRSFVTGAGHVTPDRLTYSQKLEGLTAINQYGDVGSIYRSVPTEGSRLEVRCNDINISDWATTIRTGSMALAIAIAQTPGAGDLQGPSSGDVLRKAKKSNVLNLQPDGTIKSTELLRNDIDFQQRLADYALSKLPKYTGPLPDDYVHIAEELGQYCDDMTSVVDGNQTIAILADRADWAAKMYGIKRKVDAANKAGESRTMHDIRAEALDMSYDSIEVVLEDGQVKDPKYGWGYKFREAGIFRDVISYDDVDHAYSNPPQNTRAALRSKLMKEYVVGHVNWYAVHVRDKTSPHSPASIKIVLDDVLQTELYAEDNELLLQAITREL